MPIYVVKAVVHCSIEVMDVLELDLVTLTTEFSSVKVTGPSSPKARFLGKSLDN